MLAKEPFIVPIPGSRKFQRIDESFGAADVALTESKMRALEAKLANIGIHGNRTDEDIAKLYRKSQV